MKTDRAIHRKRSDRLRSGSVGSAQGVISKQDIANTEFPLPPLNEQWRIVERLGKIGLPQSDNSS